MQNFTLPSAAEFNIAENYAENLRPTIVAGQNALEPTGLPRVVLNDAGAHICPLPDGRIVTVAANHRLISVDGVEAGTLGADFRSAMVDGERIAVFTDAATEWIAGGTLQSLADGNVDVNLSQSDLSADLTAEVFPPATLKGTYQRLSTPLQSADCQSFANAVQRSLTSLSAQAALRGMLVQPAWVSWRMLDSAGCIVARGNPQRFGSIQGKGPITFQATKSDSTFSVKGSSLMSGTAFSLRVSVQRSKSEFWRRRARTLEILLRRDCVALAGVTGYFTETSGSDATLTLSPLLAETEPEGNATIAARFDLPLEGLDTQIFLTDLGEADPETETAEEFIPSAVCYCGNIRAYAPAGMQGVIAVARAADPLTLRISAQICEGRILHICVPRGGGGGWNYGRHHLLAFTTAGIYAVSVDSTLRSISATPLANVGISRADAVVSATDAIFCATSSGFLLRISGSRIEQVECPCRAAALGWAAGFGELLVLDPEGKMLAIDSRGGVSMRSLTAVRSFVEPDMAITAAGSLVNLSREQPVAAPIVWRRRISVPKAKNRWHKATFFLDTARAINLGLTLSADSGGGTRRLVDLLINGPVNAPLTMRLRTTPHPYITCSLNGPMLLPARLVRFQIAN